MEKNFILFARQGILLALLVGVFFLLVAPAPN